MKIQWKTLSGCILIPLAVGTASALFTRHAMEAFDSLKQPPLTPPGWLFPIVWTILYILMGIASYLVLTAGGQKGSLQAALGMYGLQLWANFLWPLFFFCLELYLFSFFWLLLLWFLILGTFFLFRRFQCIFIFFCIFNAIGIHRSLSYCHVRFIIFF